MFNRSTSIKQKKALAVLITGGLIAAGSLFAVLAQPGGGPLPPVAALPGIGQRAPDFRLPDENGKTHRLADYRGKVLLIAFYPADFTPGCSIEAHTMSSEYKDMTAAGLTPIGVSVQSVSSHKSFCHSFGIPYPLLADTGKKMAADYGVLNTQMMGGIANRTTFIVTKSGNVAYIDQNVNGHLTTCAQDWITWTNSHQADLN